ncbi:MAG: hypothetical protein KKI12_00575 [Proteobacteria bacterium]|nr:hypothetical protein [Pseudomonadota bacterium]MBU4259034.1 hypothetical protein [Pseudomonadota bacterium]MBU4286652.1 hypothetical protein [Pseudomonadota bacterium]MBU4413980.1 hypothetical protein [Pseudomonadota bacterium]MCG2758964.1 hypothetical protein [Desulfobacteraceae bacterium]
MTDSVDKKTYTLFMPGEERIFLNHFHTIAIALLLIAIAFQVVASETAVADAMVTGFIFVLPLYFIYFVFGKRFADSVTLDFDARKVRFSFSDERGSFERDFQDIEKINFRFYLTFVMDDARIMVKRPYNKKEVFRLLRNVSKVDVGMFGGF